jgi:uncharacterized membrane protein
VITREMQTQSRARTAQQERYETSQRSGRGRAEEQVTGSTRSAQGQRGPLTDALGWFSLGLGLVQLVAPDAVARLIGVNENAKSSAAIRLIGVRELTSGFGIMAQRKPAGWVWARVGGDLMDLALLGRNLDSDEVEPNRVRNAFLAVLGITALDVVDSLRYTTDGANGNPQQQGYDMHVRKSITVNRTRQEVYSFWRNFQNLPRFMEHLESVQVTGDRTSHWKTKAPLGQSVEWDAEIINDRPNELIAWHSLENATVDNSGTVRFADAPGGRGTEVHVELHYEPPAGAIGNVVARLFGEAPDQQVYDDMAAFKQVMETGEILFSDATIHDHPHPAQPSTKPVEVVQTGATI